MPKNKIHKHIKILIPVGFLFLFIVLAFLLFRPVLTSFLWALIVAVGFRPVYSFLNKKIKFRSIAALISCVLILLVIIVPVWQLSLALYRQSAKFIERTEKLSESKSGSKIAVLANGHNENNKSNFFNGLKNIENYFNEKLSPYDIKIDLIAFLKDTLINVSRFFTSMPYVIRAVSVFFLDFFFFFIMLFFLFRNGREVSDYFRSLLVYEREKVNIFMHKFKEITRSSILSSLIISLVQGTLGFIIYMILKVEEPLLWAVFTSLASFIPLIGATTAWLTVVIIFLINNNLLSAFILFLYGTFIISTSDNIIRPLLIKDRANVHPVILFFSIISGIRTMGFIGIFLGPLILTFVLTALEMFRESIKE